MRLSDAWLKFRRWLSNNTSPADDFVPEQLPTDWQGGETEQIQQQFTEASGFWGNTLLWLAAGIWDAKLAAGVATTQPNQTQVQNTAADVEAGFKFLAVGVVVAVLIKKLFF